MDLKFKSLEELIILGAEIKFIGILNFNKTNEILIQIEDFIKQITDSNILQKRIYHTSVEMLQKITYWNSSKKVYFYFKHANNKIHILIKDTINSDKKDKLVTLIDEINHLCTDKKRLKLYYKNIMTSGKISQKGGQGIGLIHIVKKSGNKLLYNFEQQNKETFKFSIIASVDITS